MIAQNTIQAGNAISLDRAQKQWVDLGDVSGYSCFSRPETCGPDGASLTAWINILDCPVGCGFLGFADNDDTTGLKIECRSNRIK